MLFFKEAIGKRIWIAILVITLASILLSFDPEAKWGFSVSALGIILACLLWGMDNNFTRKLSIKDPFTIVIVKGLGAGSFSLILALILQQSFPDLKTILLSLALGAVSYGLSLLFIVMAMRDLGSTRSTALFGTAPFLGALISFLMTGDLPGSLFLASMGLMIVGSYLVLKEAHEHEHTHEVLTHDHKHRHDDGHHNHTHEGKEASLEHSHAHTHEVLTHTHPHTPDIHHRHGH